MLSIGGIAGLHVCQTVMIYNAGNLCLIESGDRLSDFVVIYQHNTLPLWSKQMIPAQRSDNLVVFVKEGISAVTALQDRLAHIVEEIVQMKTDKILFRLRWHAAAPPSPPAFPGSPV